MSAAQSYAERIKELDSEISERQTEISRIKRHVRDIIYVPEIKKRLEVLLPHFPGLWFSVYGDEYDGTNPEFKFHIGSNEVWGYLSDGQYRLLTRSDEAEEIMRMAREYFELFNEMLGRVEPCQSST